jgi:hypothetical protein
VIVGSNSQNLVILPQGLEHLHNNVHIAHGRLNVRTCLITQYWSIRLSEFGINAVLDDLCSRDCITIDMPNPNG